MERLLPIGSASQPEPQQHQAFSSPVKQQGEEGASGYGKTPLRYALGGWEEVGSGVGCGVFGGQWPAARSCDQERSSPHQPSSWFAHHKHLPARPHTTTTPSTHPPTFRSPRVTYSDRFIPSRATSSRLDFSILDREAAASETPRRAAEKEESNGAYNLLLRSELLGCPAVPLSPEKGGGGTSGLGSMAAPPGVHPASPSKRCVLSCLVGGVG